MDNVVPFDFKRGIRSLAVAKQIASIAPPSDPVAAYRVTIWQAGQPQFFTVFNDDEYASTCADSWRELYRKHGTKETFVKKEPMYREQA